MEDKNNPTSEISKDNLNYFRFLTDENGAFKLVKSYYKFIKVYHDAYNQFSDIIINFLKENEFESYVIKTPFFQIAKEIKNFFQVQREQLNSILKNQLFKLDKSLKNLNIDLKSFQTYDANYKDFIKNIHKSLNDLERNLIDNYINKKYEKHLKDISNDQLKDIIKTIDYYKSSCLLTKNEYKHKLVKNNDALVTTFNEMKTVVKEIIVTLKKNNKDCLDELQKKVDLLSFGEKIEEDKKEINEENKNEIIQDNKVENQKEKGKVNDLNKFIEEKLEIPKYKLQLLNNPKFEVIKAKDNKKKNL